MEVPMLCIAIITGTVALVALAVRYNVTERDMEGY